MCSAVDIMSSTWAIISLAVGIGWDKTQSLITDKTET